MKKAIISTISSILGVAAITTTAIFLPTYVSSQGYSTYFYDFRQALIDNNDNQDTLKFNERYMNATNVNMRELLLGNNSINNGTYILYIGSEGYANHRNFLYGDSSKTDNDFLLDINPALKGTFGTGLRFFLSKQYDQFRIPNYGDIPVLTYLDEIQSYDINARFEYENLILNYKELVYEKDTEGAETLTEDELAINKKKHDWAVSAPKFSLEPGATYIDWEGNTQYFRFSYQSGVKFNELVNMVKKLYPTLNDVNGASVGILIGFKEGKIASLFSGSFGSSSGNEEETPPSEDSGNSSTSPSSRGSSVLFNNEFLKPFKSNAKLNDITSISANNSFISWIDANYMK